jgi:hypothetical protein
MLRGAPKSLEWKENATRGHHVAQPLGQGPVPFDRVLSETVRVRRWARAVAAAAEPSWRLKAGVIR